VTLVDTASGGLVTAGAPAEFEVGIEQDGAPLDLSGKTVQATIRTAARNQVVVNDLLEGIDATVITDLGVDEEFPWRVRVELTGELTALLEAPNSAALSREYYLQLVVDDSEYAPNPLKFEVRRAAAEL